MRRARRQRDGIVTRTNGLDAHESGPCGIPEVRHRADEREGIHELAGLVRVAADHEGSVDAMVGEAREQLGEVRAVAMRLAFGAGLVAAFALGSVGAFLAFDWPPLLREMVLGDTARSL